MLFPQKPYLGIRGCGIGQTCRCARCRNVCFGVSATERRHPRICAHFRIVTCTISEKHRRYSSPGIPDFGPADFGPPDFGASDPPDAFRRAAFRCQANQHWPRAIEMHQTSPRPLQRRRQAQQVPPLRRQYLQIIIYRVVMRLTKRPTQTHLH